MIMKRLSGLVLALFIGGAAHADNALKLEAAARGAHRSVEIPRIWREPNPESASA